MLTKMVEKQKLTLENGLEVWIDPKPIKKSAAFLVVESGHAMDITPETAHLLEHIQGAASKIYGYSGRLTYIKRNAETDFGHTIYSYGNILPKHLSVSVNNLANVLASPNISVLERERDAARNELKAHLNPFKLITERVFSLVLPNHSRYVHGIRSSLVSIDTVNENDCKEFWEKHYYPANSILYIGGELPDSIDELT